MAYRGALKAKLPTINLLGDDDPEQQATFKRAAMERHEALFREFGIEPPAPDDVGNPAWRELALALAKRHVPAFVGKQGRPASARTTHERWFFASYFFQIKDNLNVRDADRMVAKHFNIEERAVLERLKELRRNGAYKIGIHDFVVRIKKRGKAHALSVLSDVMKPDLEFNSEMAVEAEEVARLERWPY